MHYDPSGPTRFIHIVLSAVGFLAIAAVLVSLLSVLSMKAGWM